MIELEEIGPDKQFCLREPIDYLYPGTVARVFLGFLTNGSGIIRQQAVKILRPEKLKALDTIRTEVEILCKLKDRAYITPLGEVGFFHLNMGEDLPKEWHENFRSPRLFWATNMKAKVDRYSLDEVDLFFQHLEEKASPDCLPYLAIDKRDFSGAEPTEPFLFQIFPPKTPVESIDSVKLLVEIATKICRVIEDFHQHQIYYEDFKLAHFCWISNEEKVKVIDWNLSHLMEQPLSPAQKRQDLRHFGAKVIGAALTGDISIYPYGGPIPWEKVTREDCVPSRLMEIADNLVLGKYDSAGMVHNDLRKMQFGPIEGKK